MTDQYLKIWEIAAGSLLIAGAAALGAWLIFRRRPTPEERELARRQFLTQSGRLVDGNLLDITEITIDGGRILTLLVYGYRIGGVDYECSQDITALSGILDAALIRAGFPCSVRYQPGNPQNSIVVAESWSGLRTTVPVFPAYEDPEPIDTSHLHRKPAN
jgi:hypothetical protein